MDVELISREAALEAIDGMKPTQGNIEQLAMKALCWAAIKTVKPVNAIPVWWLETVRNDADEAGDLEMRDAITGLIDEWHRKEKN